MYKYKYHDKNTINAKYSAESLGLSTAGIWRWA